MKGAALVAGSVIAVVGLGVGIVATAYGTRPSIGGRYRGQATTENLPAIDSVRAIARRAVRANADAAADNALVILTTRERAAGGDIVNSNQPVYELVIRGHFVCGLCSRPPESSAPSGSVLILTLDRSDLALTDFGIAEKVPVVPSTADVYSFRF